MNRGYAVICDARGGEDLGIHTLVLVDRSKSRSQWWTSDDPSIALKYNKESAAQYAANRLRMNNIRVVRFEDAYRTLVEQMNELAHHEACAAVEEF